MTKQKRNQIVQKDEGTTVKGTSGRLIRKGLGPRNVSGITKGGGGKKTQPAGKGLVGKKGDARTGRGRARVRKTSNRNSLTTFNGKIVYTRR